MREIVNAIRYQGRTGCQWDYLPHDLPPRRAVYCYSAKWCDDGVDQTIHDLLRPGAHTGGPVPCGGEPPTRHSTSLSTASSRSAAVDSHHPGFRRRLEALRDIR
ncbi:hypothetical protein GCM10010430_68060 [Kitasatospora cystarginea]|uniref:Insertion element IS402-like domain-containing protein n=1 Tax=Kitasatospora cystarginea TaxID=58350 RepID=A0ABP5RRK0_9ACTN